MKQPHSDAAAKPLHDQLQSSRRRHLYSLTGGIGAVALHAMLHAGQDPIEKAAQASADTQHAGQPSVGQQPHLPTNIRNCIFLMMEGGPSHIDTFDPKPALESMHLKEFVRAGESKSAMESGKRYFVRSPFRFVKAGDCGADMADNWQHLAGVANEICFYRGCQVDSVNHPTAMYQMNTGNRFAGDPAIGAWMTYGLGSANQNLPGFIVLPEVSFPQGGASNWGNGYLPAQYQGTALRPTGAPILDLKPRPEFRRDHQRTNLDLLAQLNEQHAARHPGHSELTARMEAYELAFRMQIEVPGLLDIAGESKQTLEQYGVDQQATDAFGRKCLLARRLVESGVRFVQLYAGTWDSHDYIERAHSNLIRQVDRPISALIADLKERGLLESTLIVWCGEFGRSPDNGVRGGTAFGRDHNPSAMTVWLAGGGVKAGHTIGATDELGAEAVDCVHHVRDLHVTLLRIMGLDDNRLNFFHGGRFKQLSQFGGSVIDDLLS